MSKGTLFGVGLGPGDPDLITRSCISDSCSSMFASSDTNHSKLFCSRFTQMKSTCTEHRHMFKRVTSYVTQ